MANKSYKEQAGIQSENDQAEGQAVGQGEALKAVAPNNGATTDNLARSKWRRASEVLQS